MTIHASGITGKAGTNTTDTYVGEVFVDNSGNYIGDFSAGAGVDGVTPLGFAHGMSSIYTGPTPSLFGDFWNNPSQHNATPIAPLLFTFPTLSAAIVSDPSGPPGFESKNACQLTFAGCPNGMFAWVGETASQSVDVYPTSTTGWVPTVGSIWCMSGWFRAAPDVNGAVVQGFRIGMDAGRRGYTTSGAAVISGSQEITLSQSWQQINFRFEWVWATADGVPVPAYAGSLPSWANNVTETHNIPPFGNLTLTKYDTFGSVLMKELHLWSCKFQGPRHINTKV